MAERDYIRHVDELDELVDDIARLRERVRKLGEEYAEGRLLDVEVLLCDHAQELRPLADKQARAYELAEERQYREARGT